MSPKIRLMILAGTALATGVANAQSVDQTREYAAEVMADAQQRTSLLGSAAGSNAQFGVTSADGTSTLNWSGWFQTTYTVSIMDDNGGADDDFESGFQTPDTRLIFDGTVVSPDTSYKIEIYVDESGNFGLMDAYLAQDFGNHTSGWVGQFTAPVTRESMVEDNNLQTIERTPTNWFFGAGQVQGAAFSMTDEANSYRVTGSFNDGAGTGDTPYNTLAGGGDGLGGDGDWSFTFRGDLALEGEVDPYFATTRQLPGGQNAMIVGGYVHFQGSPEAPGAVDSTVIQAGADFLMDNNETGWNVFVSGNLRSTDSDGNADEFLDLGLVVQGGYFATPNTEIFGSWDILIPDEDRLGGNADPFNTIAVGVNHFPFDGTQAVRLTGQVTIFLDTPAETGIVGMNTNAGLLSTSDSSVAAQGLAQVSF